MHVCVDITSAFQGHLMVLPHCTSHYLFRSKLEDLTAFAALIVAFQIGYTQYV